MKIMDISSQKKKQMCQIYFKRQTLSNRYEFTDWYLNDQETKLKFHQIETYNKNYYSYLQRRGEIKHQIELIDAFLEKGLVKYSFLYKDVSKKRTNVKRLTTRNVVSSLKDEGIRDNNYI